ARTGRAAWSTAAARRGHRTRWCAPSCMHRRSPCSQRSRCCWLRSVCGAVASIVTQRARQIGICMALGATSSRVVRETARQGLVPIVVGLVIGAPLALGAGYVVRQQLFAVQPNDPITLGSVAVLMLAVTAAASLCPAMRAAKIDPA